MFKKLSIIALSVTGIALAGCSNQTAKSDSSNDKPKTEKVAKKKTPTKKDSTDNQTATTDKTNNEASVTKPATDNKSTDNSQTKTDNTTNSQTNNQNNAPATNIKTGEEAVTYLFTKLTNIDKTQISALYNGTVYDMDGKTTYRINLYKKGEQQPYSAYNVYPDGTYTQVW